MAKPDPDLTPLGQLLEQARRDVLRISGREAARRAGMSEGRWRQIVNGGHRKAGGVWQATRPTERVAVAMALAVQLDPAEALRVEGYEVDHLDVLVEDVRHALAAPPAAEPALPDDEDLVAEIERIRSLPITASARIRMMRALVDVYVEAHGSTPTP